MKVTVERTELLKVLSHVHRVVERRNTIPIIGNVLVRAESGKIAFKATDLDLEIVETIAAEVASGGAITVPARMLYEIVRKLPEGAMVVLEASGERATMSIRASRSRFSLQTLPDSDFPDLAAGELPYLFTLAADDLKRLIDKTAFAISTEETWYYLRGIYLHAVIGPDGERMLRAVATDGHRLAQFELAAPPGTEAMPGIIVPRKTVGEVQRLIDDEVEEVSVELSQSKIRFNIGSVTLTSKLIDGQFPDYSRVVPLGNDKLIEVNKSDFKHAVDRVSTVASERGRAIKLALSFENHGDPYSRKSGRLALSVNNVDSGSGAEELDVSFCGAPLEMGFNSRYLLDIAAQIDGETAVIKLGDPGTPALFADKDEKSALYVLMPMRV